MATVQLTVFKSEADYFDAEVPVRSAGFGVYFDGFHVQTWSVPWDVWLIAEEKRHVNAKTDGKYQRKPAATPQVTTTIDPKEILSELCSERECLLLSSPQTFSTEEDMKVSNDGGIDLRRATIAQINFLHRRWFYFSFTVALPRWDLSFLRKIGRIDPRWDLSFGLRKIRRNDPRWDLSFVLGEILRKNDPCWDLSFVLEQVRKNHELKVLAPHEGGASIPAAKS